MSKTNDGFKKIRHVSDWGDWERFGGTGEKGVDGGIRSGDAGDDIVDGSVMIVRWPDKTETKETVHYEAGRQSISDMGHTYEGLDEYAYVNTKFRGMKIKVKIRGLYCKLVSLPKRAKK
jgi:hypothetical protein